LSIEYFSSDSSHVSGAWSRQYGKVEALLIIVAANIFDGEGVASEPLDWVLLRIILSDPQRFEFLWEKQIAKPSREGGEAVIVACRGGLLASYFFNSAAGIVAAA
jgi:hypothetical protein